MDFHGALSLIVLASSAAKQSLADHCKLQQTNAQPAAPTPFSNNSTNSSSAIRRKAESVLAKCRGHHGSHFEQESEKTFLDQQSECLPQAIPLPLLEAALSGLPPPIFYRSAGALITSSPSTMMSDAAQSSGSCMRTVLSTSLVFTDHAAIEPLVLNAPEYKEIIAKIAFTSLLGLQEIPASIGLPSHTTANSADQFSFIIVFEDHAAIVICPSFRIRSRLMLRIGEMWNKVLLTLKNAGGPILPQPFESIQKEREHTCLYEMKRLVGSMTWGNIESRSSLFKLHSQLRRHQDRTCTLSLKPQTSRNNASFKDSSKLAFLDDENEEMQLGEPSDCNLYVMKAANQTAHFPPLETSEEALVSLTPLPKQLYVSPRVGAGLNLQAKCLHCGTHIVLHERAAHQCKLGL